MRKYVNRSWSMTGSATVALALTAFAAYATAGCGIMPGNFYAANADWVSSMTPAVYRPMTAFAAAADQPQPQGADIVGMWRIKFVAKNSPPIPDGTVVDAGFSQWHSDGTEIMNSSKPPATQNFCLGVWKKIGPSTFKLLHKALGFDLAGNLLGEFTIREEVTVDRTGQSFSGTFTITDPTGHTVAGEVLAERITVD